MPFNPRAIKKLRINILFEIKFRPDFIFRLICNLPRQRIKQNKVISNLYIHLMAYRFRSAPLLAELSCGFGSAILFPRSPPRIPFRVTINLFSPGQYMRLSHEQLFLFVIYSLINVIRFNMPRKWQIFFCAKREWFVFAPYGAYGDNVNFSVCFQFLKISLNICILVQSNSLPKNGLIWTNIILDSLTTLAIHLS